MLNCIADDFNEYQIYLGPSLEGCSEEEALEVLDSLAVQSDRAVRRTADLREPAQHAGAGGRDRAPAGRGI